MPVFIAAQIIIDKSWRQCPSADEWHKKCGIYKQLNSIVTQKKIDL